MKKLIFPILIIVLSGVLAVSCEEDRIEGSGTITTEVIEVSDFTGIRLEGVSDVHIEHGADLHVEATGHPNIISRIQTDVKNGVWHMELQSGSYGSYELTYDIVMPALNKVSNIGTGNVIISDFNHQPSLEIYLEGSGSYLGFPLTAENCSVEILGSGDAEVSANKSLDVDIEGSGNVYYKGSPSITEDISGSGKVIDSN